MLKLTRSLMLLAPVFALTGMLSGCSATVSPDCDRAMKSAEYESVQEDAALLATLTACPTAAEWVDAIKAHPSAGIYTEYTTETARESLDNACIRAISAPACVDAAEQGILTFDLDDPRLAELQL